MAIDTAEKRKSISGIHLYANGPGVTPNAAQDREWRHQVAYGYSGILVGIITAQGNLVGNGQLSAIGQPLVEGIGSLDGSGRLIAAIFNGPQIHLKGQYEPEINLAGSV